jgi:hypothetical protein
VLLEESAKATPLVTPPVQLYVVAPVPLKVTDDPAQIVDEGDAVTPTVGKGFTVTANDVAALVPHELLAVTEIFPDVVPKVTVMDAESCPELMTAPEGTVHEYPVAPATALTEYVFCDAAQTVDDPVMDPGEDGVVEQSISIKSPRGALPSVLLKSTSLV